MSKLFSLFSGGELLRVAIQQEENGEKFYEGVAAKARDENAQKAFKMLAAAERQHVKDFEGLAALLPPGDSLDSERGEFEAYAEALLETTVFAADNTGQELANKANSDLEAIDAALAFEKDTILFMYDMRDYAKDEALEVVEAVLEQEKQHVVRLTEVRKSLQPGSCCA